MKFTKVGLILATTLLMLFCTFNVALAWTISGTVYGGSNPLPNTTVTLKNAATSMPVGTTTTNASGMYSLPASDGSYDLTITPPGGSGLSESVVNGIVVNGADVSQNVVLVQQAVTLSGGVKNPGGTGIQNVYVQIQDSTSGVSAGSACTDANGNYSVALASGTYRVNLYGGSYTYYGNCGTTTNVPTPKYFEGYGIAQNLAISGNTTQNITIPIVTMSGKTTDSNGVAVGNVTVDQPGRSVAQSVGSYYASNAYSYSPVKSDASGNYSMVLIAGSGYSVTLIPPTGTGLAQTVVSGIDVPSDTTRSFALQSAVTLSGVVKNPGGAGIQNVYVQIQDNTSGVSAGSACTDANGNYSVALASGTYRVNLYGGSYTYYGNCGTTTNVPTPKYFEGYGIAQNLAISGNTTQNITIPIVTMSGKTTDSNGVAVGNVTVNQPGRSVAQSVGSYYVSNSYSYSPVKSDVSGNYSMVLIAGSGYSVTLIPPTGTGLAQTVVSGIDVPSDTTRSFALQSAVTLSGVVKNPGGAGIQNVYVQIQDNTSGVSAGSACTDANGNYSVALASGAYRVNLYGGSYTYYGNCGTTTNVPTPKYFEGYGIAQNLAISGNTTQNITIPIVTMSGKTTDSNGVAVGNVTVDQPGRSVAQSVGSYYVSNAYSYSPVKSDASGNYSMVLIAGSGYSETIIPPTGSGFAQTVVNNLNVTKSVLQNIILSMPDTNAPIIISGPTVSSYSDTTATIEWQTNEPAKGALVYGTSNPPTGTTIPESAFTATHSQSLTGLSANTTYYVKVTASDAANNGPATSSIVSFTTKPTADKTPPEILTGPTISSITDTSAVVEWTTNEPSTGSVAYGLSSTPNLTVADATLATSHRVTLTGLTAETVYYLKVAATDASNNGPTSSSVISFPTVAAPDTTAPVIIEGPMAINVSDSGATIVWKTDEPSTSGVSWNDGTVYGVLSDNSLATNHSMTITGLAATKTYSYTVSSKDAFNNGPTLSTAKTFTTSAAPDTKPPIFTQAPIVKNTTHQSAVLYWETDEPSSTTIQYGTTQSFGTADAKAQLLTTHNRPLTGLLPGTTYYFRVQATDSTGNTATGQIYTFTTDVNPDTKAPVITEEASIVYSTDTAATVAFSTDKPCDTVVNYGANGTTGNQKSNSEKVNDHQITLTNLTPNTSYNVQVSCTDMSGNTVVASAGKPSTYMAMNYSFILSDALVGASGKGFVTPSLPDITPPLITDTPRATVTTTTMARIHWLTDEIADSQVFYGLSGQSLSSFAGNITKSAGHSVALTNLSPNTTYQFKVQSTDPSNNTTTSAVYTFTTAALADTTPPVISAVSARGTTSSQINVSWASDEQSSTVLKYGTTPFTLTAQIAIAGSRTSHSAALYNLVPGTTYYVAPVSTDSSGNTTQGDIQSVTLAGAAPASYTVTASAGTGGSVTPLSQAVYSGYQLALAVTPAQGYMVNSITGCGGTLIGSVYTTAAITSNCTVSASFKIDPNFTGTILTTTAYPPAGTYAGGTLMVKLKANTPSAAIYYTTDGSTPSTSSAVYSGAIPVVGTKAIKFFAKDGATLESAKSATYTVTATGQPGASFSGLKPGSSFTVYRSEGGKAPTSIYSGTQTSFADSGSLKPNTIYSYTVASDQEGATELISVKTPLYNGWNIIAVPYNTTGVPPTSFFATPVSSIYEWIPTGATAESSTTQLGSYKTVTALTPGLGYFAKASGSSTLLTYNGAAVPASVTVTLKPGWTMIANPNVANKTNIGTTWLVDGNPLSDAINTNKIGGSIYWWNGTTYDSWTILGNNPQVEPWKGYWMINLESVNHTLTIQ